jgi:uncharacterized protein
MEVHQFKSLQPGPKLIVLGAVHGNEVCGAVAIARVLAEFAQGKIKLQRGQVSFVPVVNALAYAKGQREGDRNLNRDFRPAVVPLDNEDRIANLLAPLLAEHDALLDIHSFKSQGQAFIFAGPENNEGALEPFKRQLEEESFAAALGPRRIVHGWLPAYELGVKRRANDKVSYGVGTTEYMRAAGGYAVTLECGNHADPLAPVVAYQAIHRALKHLSLVAELPTDFSPASGALEVLEMYEVIDRLQEGDQFVQSWTSFDALSQDQVIAHRQASASDQSTPTPTATSTPIRAPQAGRIVFPNAGAALGREWFYLARESHRRFLG